LLVWGSLFLDLLLLLSSVFLFIGVMLKWELETKGVCLQIVFLRMILTRPWFV
jgi:hypothetical protein